MASRGEISKAKVKEWESATPEGKHLPERVKESHARGVADALDCLGFKVAAHELRLKLKQRKYHGYDNAVKSAEEGLDADVLADIMDELPVNAEQAAGATADPLDRPAAWGAPTNPAGGDVAGRISDLGQPSAAGKAY